MSRRAPPVGGGQRHAHAQFSMRFDLRSHYNERFHFTLGCACDKPSAHTNNTDFTQIIISVHGPWNGRDEDMLFTSCL